MKFMGIDGKNSFKWCLFCLKNCFGTLICSKWSISKPNNEKILWYAMATALILTLIAILRADSVDYETQNQFHYKLKKPRWYKFWRILKLSTKFIHQNIMIIDFFLWLNWNVSIILFLEDLVGTNSEDTKSNLNNQNY